VIAATADAIFLELADLDAEARARRLRDRCDHDPQLRKQVEALLAQVDQDTSAGAAEVPRDFLDPRRLRLASARAAGEARVTPGARLDEFTVLRVIGSGGSGVVYVAQQDRPRRTVALKVLRDSADTAGMRRRFALEAELLGRLQHPGIAQVFKAQFDDPIGPPFIAMELVNGPPLTEYAEARQLAVRDRLRLGAQVCEAVHHAHQRGVIHRDLKPGNILVGEDGQPKVLDFGIARAVTDEAHLLTVQTLDGQVLGTLPYMSPEQVSGSPREVDTRTDIYALGVILYRLLAGRLPFDLSDCALPDAARRIRDDEPTRLAAIDPALRGDVDVVVARAMAKDKERRYQSAAQLANDLRHAAAGDPISALDDSAWYILRQRLRRYRRVAIAAGIALIAGLGLTAYALRARQQAEVANAQLTNELSLATIERGRLSGLTTNLPLAESLLWRELREGPNAEYARWALRELYLHSPSAWVSPRDTGDARNVRISPDSHLVATTGLNGAVRLWDAETGRARGSALSITSIGPTVSFVSDSEVVAGGDDGSVQVWAVRTMAKRAAWPAHTSRIVALAAAGDRGVAVTAGEAGDLRASRLADGAAQWMIAAADAPAKDAHIRAIEIDAVAVAGIVAVTWSTGHVDLRALDTGRLIRRWRAHDVSDADWPCVAFQPVSDGVLPRLLATGSVDRTVRLWDVATGRRVAELRPSNGTVRSVTFSPDGRSLAMTGWWRIEVWDVARAARVRADIGTGEGWSDARFTSSGTLLSVSGYGVLRAWELSSRAVRTERVDIGDDDRLTSFVSDRALRGWILATNSGLTATAAVARSGPSSGPVRVATTSADGRWFATAGEHPAAVVWRADSVNTRDATPHAGAVQPGASDASPETARAIDEPGLATAAAFSPDGRWLALGFLDGRVLLWDVAAARVVWRGRSDHGDEVLGLAFDHASTRLLSAHRHWVVEDWRVSTGEHVRSMKTPATAFSLAIDRDGHHAAVGMWSGNIDLWDLDRGERIRELAGHSRVVRALQFDDASGRLFSASRDGTVRLWNVDAGHELAQLAREPVGVEGLRVDESGRALIFGTEDGRIVRVAVDQLDRYVELNAPVWPR
jgi:WD40 repeat protein/predicted Ser/Thr protein kinase